MRHGITVFVLVLVVEYLVVPELVLARKSVHALGHVNLFLLFIGLALEVVCQIGYARLTMVLLPDGALSFSKVFRINLSALGVSHILPGGTAGGTGLGYRLMATNGLRGTDIAVQAATQGIGSAVLLNAMLWLALVISIPLNGFRPVYVSVAIVTALLLAAFGALAYLFTRGEGSASRALRSLARRLRFIPEDRVADVLGELTDRLRHVARDRRLLAAATSWAALNWLADAACLWVCLAAFHFYLNPVDLFVAYGVGNVLAAIPITPGGLGPVEAAVPLVLRGFGVPVGFGTLAVLGWRLYNFWLPIPVGAACYVSLRVQRGASFKERRAVLKGITRQAVAAPAPPGAGADAPAPGGASRLHPQDREGPGGDSGGDGGAGSGSERGRHVTGSATAVAAAPASLLARVTRLLRSAQRI